MFRIAFLVFCICVFGGPICAFQTETKDNETDDVVLLRDDTAAQFEEHRICETKDCQSGLLDKLLPADDNWDVDLGGYAKVDLIYDFNPIESTDFFDPKTIPTDGSSGRNARLHARQTRLFMDAKNQTDLGDIKIYVEGDFFGTGNTLRLRHGFGEFGGLLGGQTWSTFIDESILPATIDFESPVGELVTRRAMLRWTQDMAFLQGAQYSLAIEEPGNAALFSATGTLEDDLPDFIGRVRIDRECWHAQVAAFFTEATFRPDVGTPSDATAWAFSFSGSRKVVNDTFYFQMTFGDGAERFRSLQSYVLDPSGNLVAIPGVAWFIGYEHIWTRTFRSVVTYSGGDLDFPAGNPAELDVAEYVSANLLWSPNERFQAGIEYLYGTRTDQNAAYGQANRMQFGVWYFLR